MVWRGGRGRTSKGNKALSFAHCFCLVTFLLKFHSPVFGKGSCCKNNHRAKSNDPTLCQVPHPPPSTSPAPHRLARVQCSLCALLVSIAKSCVLEVCCCPPYPDLHSCLPLPHSPQLCPAALCGISCTCFSYQKMQDSCKIYLKC